MKHFPGTLYDLTFSKLFFYYKYMLRFVMSGENVYIGLITCATLF